MLEGDATGFGPEFLNGLKSKLVGKSGKGAESGKGAGLEIVWNDPVIVVR
jgi:hypothetical protein